MSMDVGTHDCPCVYNDIHDLEGHIHHNFLSDLGRGTSAFSWPVNKGMTLMPFKIPPRFWE